MGVGRQVEISIHALREEGDVDLLDQFGVPGLFLSTPSARRATQPCHSFHPCSCISIHALREEGDLKTSPISMMPTYFYPRPPRGGRRKFFRPRRRLSYFYPRPPRGGRPSSTAFVVSIILFLSTPSARRATRRRLLLGCWPWNFYPRPPRGGRQSDFLQPHPVCGISIHALREEGDRQRIPQHPSVCYFYPRPPRGGRRSDINLPSGIAYFYPRPPRGGRPGYVYFVEYWRLISIHALREEGDCPRAGP